jgi:hypothetical protein
MEPFKEDLGGRMVVEGVVRVLVERQSYTQAESCQ